jgi:hypothetical protein
MAIDRSGEGSAVDSPAKVRREQPEGLPESCRQVTRVRKAELRSERGEPGLGIREAVEGRADPQLVSILEEREPGVRSEEAAQLESRDVERSRDLGHREPLPEARVENQPCVIDDLALRRARRLTLFGPQIVEATAALDRRLERQSQRSLDELELRLRFLEVPDGESLEKEDRRVAGPGCEWEARESAREPAHQCRGELDVIAMISGPAPERAEKPLSGVVEDDLVSIANGGLASELANRDRGAREDHMRLGRNAVQAVPPLAVWRAPELPEEKPVVGKENPANRVRSHSTLQTSTERGSSAFLGGRAHPSCQKSALRPSPVQGGLVLLDGVRTLVAR